MTLMIQALPLAAIVLLLARGTDPLRAVAAALVLALPAAAVSVPSATRLLPLLVGEAARGTWLALQPIAITLAGLLFHGAVSARRVTVVGPQRPDHAALFNACLLLGPFFETVTGFGVGAVFALGDLRALGVTGAPAAALSLLSQVLIPWGGLGPGTLLGAALARVDLRALGAWNALLSAAWLLTLLPLFWRLAREAGLPADAGDRRDDLLVLLALGAMLILANLVTTVEVAGLLSLGPVLAWRLRAAARRPGAMRAALPYLGLAALLLASRLAPGASGLLTSAAVLRPWPDLPAFALLHHPASLLALAAVAVLAVVPGRRRILGDAARRAARPSALMLGYVVLARLLGGSGAAAALARALAAVSGPLLPYVLAMLGAAGGFFAATNVGSNAILMPIQAVLAPEAGLPAPFVAAVQNFAGSAFCLLAPMRLGVTAALAGEGATPGSIGSRLWPAGATALAVAWAATGAVGALGLA